nr:immunoglobulin heavy chain junction region [Macaca mulatta]MOW83180.1 immunoglobulin heavy chain junction region [Macaca mulatta]
CVRDVFGAGFDFW